MKLPRGKREYNWGAKHVGGRAPLLEQESFLNSSKKQRFYNQATPSILYGNEDIKGVPR